MPGPGSQPKGWHGLGTSERAAYVTRMCLRGSIPNTIVSLLSHRIPFFLCCLCGFQKTMLWTGDFLGNLRTHRNFVFHLSSPPPDIAVGSSCWDREKERADRRRKAKREGVRKTRENQQQVGSKCVAPTGRLSAAGWPGALLLPVSRVQVARMGCPKK